MVSVVLLIPNRLVVQLSTSDEAGAVSLNFEAVSDIGASASGVTGSVWTPQPQKGTCDDLFTYMNQAQNRAVDHLNHFKPTKTYFNRLKSP